MRMTNVLAAFKRWSALFRVWLDTLRAPRPTSTPTPQPAPTGRPKVLDAAVPESQLEPIRVVPSATWARIELYRDTRGLFQQEPFIPRLYQKEPEIRKAFGDQAPHSGAWLLHVGRHVKENLDAVHQKGQQPVPVLIVHGAGCTANLFLKGVLIDTLEDSGHIVFAITFAHPHGDNWQQAEIIADAIARVCGITGAVQVDLVAHSKGAVAARLYTSDLHLPGGTPYRGDVRRLVLVASPNNGIDWAFRHPLLFWYGTWFGSAPSPFIPPLRYSLYPGGAYPGQAQMVKELRDLVPLGDPDYWNTHRLYGGGLTLYGYSYGTRWTAAAGGHLVDLLNATGVDPRVEVAVVAGNNPRLAIDGLPVMGETDGECDGVLFVESSLYTEGIVRRGARLRAADLLPLNHLELVEVPEACKWVLTHLM